MAISQVVTRGFGYSIPAVVLRGYSAGAAAAGETASTAGLRGYMALELPRLLGGIGQLHVTTDLAAIIGTMAELGETATVAGTDIDVLGLTPYLGALTGGIEVEGRITRFYCMTDDLDDAGGELGDAVTFRSVSYTIGRIERMDAGLARVELVR